MKQPTQNTSVVFNEQGEASLDSAVKMSSVSIFCRNAEDRAICNDIEEIFAVDKI